MKSLWWSATLLTGLAVWSCPTFSRAQPTQRSPRSFSLMPAPGDRARWYLASDVSALYRLTGETRSAVLQSSTEPFLFTGQLGLMKNMNQRYAVGITGSLEIDWSLWRIGLSPRFTYWLTSFVHVDVEPALIVTGATDRYVSYPGIGLHMSVSPVNWVGVDIRAERLKYVRKIYENPYTGGAVIGQDEWTETSWYAGVRSGGIPGLILAAAGGAIYLLIAQFQINAGI